VADYRRFCDNIKSKYPFTNNRERREWLIVGIFVII
jgi:hypothetical protein